jgi:hypothetical protein
MVQRELERLAGVQRETVKLIPPRQKQQSATTRPLLLYELAQAKRLEVVQLLRWKVREQSEGGVVIPYLSREKELAAVQYRYALSGENRFKWRKDDTPILYGLWRLDEWASSDTLYLCEGCTDTWTMWHAGLPALGIPSASTWKPEWWDELREFQRIVLIPDNDKAGAELVHKLANTVPMELSHRVQVLQLPDGVKDVNELWQRENASPERFKEVLAGCEIILLTDSYRNQNSRINDCLLAPLSELLAGDAERELEYVPLLGVDGLIARGAITLLGAHPKAGKTTLLVHACREWVQQNLRVVYLSEEPHTIWRERVKRFPELSTLILNSVPRAHPENWARAIRELEPDIVIVDTVRRFMPPKDENDSASVSLALAPFVDLVQHLPRTAIVLVHHTKKNLSTDGEITDIAGSHAFTAEVDAILLIAPVKEHPRQRILTPIAGRFWSFTPEPLVLELSENATEYRVLGTADKVLPETQARSAKEKVLQAVRVLGKATAEEIIEHLRSSGEIVASSHLRNMLAELVHEGKLVREGDGKRGNPYIYSVCSDVLIPTDAEQQNKPPAVPSAVSSDVLIPIDSDRQNKPPAVSSDVLIPMETSQQNNNPDGEPHLFTLPPDGGAETVDATALLELAEQHGFPRLVVEYPDGKSRLHIAGTREGWEQAIPYLQRDGVLPIAYHALCNPPSEPPPPEPLPELPSVFQNRTPLGWDLIDEFLQSASNPNNPFPLEPTEMEQVRVMLAYAEANNFPELTLTEYGYTIRGDMAGWITAAQLMAGTPAVQLATRMLIAYAERNSNRQLLLVEG